MGTKPWKAVVIVLFLILTYFLSANLGQAAVTVSCVPGVADTHVCACETECTAGLFTQASCEAGDVCGSPGTFCPNNEIEDVAACANICCCEGAEGGRIGLGTTCSYDCINDPEGNCASDDPTHICDDCLDECQAFCTDYVPSTPCEPEWHCGSWGECENGYERRTCTDSECGREPQEEYQPCSEDGFRICGIVKDVGGNPLAGANVWVEKSGTIEGSTLTLSSGNYCVGGLTGSDQQIYIIYASRYDCQAEDPETIGPLRVTTDLNAQNLNLQCEEEACAPPVLEMTQVRPQFESLNVLISWTLTESETCDEDAYYPLLYRYSEDQPFPSEPDESQNFERIDSASACIEGAGVKTCTYTATLPQVGADEYPTEYCFATRYSFGSGYVWPEWDEEVLCFTNEDEECTKSHAGVFPFCSEEEGEEATVGCMVSTGPRQYNALAVIQSCADGQVCLVVEHQESLIARCSPPPPCDKCTGLFGMFSVFGPDVVIHNEPFSAQCDETELTQCYLEMGRNQGEQFEYGIVDVFRGCDEITSCSDYHTEEACTDPCNAVSEECRWVIDETDETGTNHVCIGLTQGGDEQDPGLGVCSDCVGAECYPDQCLAYNDPDKICYYNDPGGMIEEEVHTPCVSITEMACRYYGTQGDCEGNQPVSVSSTNQVTPSNDFFPIGRCKWSMNEIDYPDGVCIKDSNGDGIDDCAEYSGEVKFNCYSDITPPETVLLLRQADPPALPRYSFYELTEERNYFEVSDEEGNLGVDPKNAGNFCLYTEGQTPCAPDGFEGIGTTPGVYWLRYYSEDIAGNLEYPIRRSDVQIDVYDDGRPAIESITFDGVNYDDLPGDNQKQVALPNPEIVITFDRDLESFEAVLAELPTGPVHLTVSGQGRIHTIQTPYLPPGNEFELVMLAATDEAAAEFVRGFSIPSTEAIELNPNGEMFLYESDQTGIADSTSFKLTVVVNDPQDQRQCWAAPTPDAGENPDMSPMQWQPNSVSQLVNARTALSLTPDNSNQDDYLKEIWVRCDITDGEQVTTTHFKSFQLGIDSSDPDFNIGQDPSPVINFGDPEAFINLSGSTDKVQCIYDVFWPTVGEDNHREGPEAFPDGGSLEDLEDYLSPPAIEDDQKANVEFIGTEIHFPQNIEPHAVPVEVTCTNPVQRTTTKVGSINVDYSEAFSIELVSPTSGFVAYGSIPTEPFNEDIELGVTTSKAVEECVYYLEEGPTTVDIEADDETLMAFSHTFTGPEGWNNITINCSTELGWVAKEYSFIVDTAGPVAPTIYSEQGDIGCTPGQIKIFARVNDSKISGIGGVARFFVHLEGPGIEPVDEVIASTFLGEEEYYMSYTYSTSDIENGEDYTFTVIAVDLSDNEGAEASLDVTQQFDHEDCYVPMRITPEFPEHGISSLVETFTPVVATDRLAECRWSMNRPDPSEEGFLHMSGQFIEDIQNGADGSMTHTMNQQYSYSDDVWIFCYDTSGFPHIKEVYFGHDFSAPAFRSIEITPQPLRDYTDRNVSVLFTTDDETVCWIGTDPVGSFDMDEHANYSTYHDGWIDYSNIEDFEEHLFVYGLKCSNGADPDLSTTVTINVTVHLTDQVVITLVSPGEYGNQNPVTFAIETNLISDCSYKAEGMADYMPLTSSDEGHYHQASLGSMESGSHVVSVECASGTKITNEQITFFLDRVDPTDPTLITNDPQCGRGAVTVRAQSNDSESGLAGYNYTLRKTNSEEDEVVDEGFIPSETFVTISYDREVLNGSTYLWAVFAEDKAGNPSGTTTARVRIFDPSEDACDFEPPIQSLDLDYIDLQTDAMVGCEDDGSGCTDTFDYTAGPVNETCDPETSEYYETPVTMYERSKFCYKVFDKASNDASGQKIVQVYDVPDHCSNGLLDVNETGLDCGGECIPCEASECGDGDINSNAEQCDGTNFGNLDGCTDMVFTFTGGNLGCSDTCGLDTRGCLGPTGGFCGDGILNPGEHCEPAVFVDTSCSELFTLATAGSIDCYNCKFDTSECTFPGNSCEVDSDCMSGMCENNQCIPAACDDGIKNGDEGGIDCGGACDACALGSECEMDRQCESGYCNDGVCDESACDDLAKNGDETGVDCGGSCPLKCPEGEGCETNNDCETGYCELIGTPHICIDNPDSDQDGIPDICEEEWGLDPYDSDDAFLDPDDDGLDNMAEYSVSLLSGGACEDACDINDADTDGDGFEDGLEVEMGYDPLDKDDHPPEGTKPIDEQNPCELNRYCDDDAGPSGLVVLFLVLGIVFLVAGVLFLVGYRKRAELTVYYNQVVGKMLANPKLKPWCDKLGIKQIPQKRAVPVRAAPARPTPSSARQPVAKAPPPQKEAPKADPNIKKTRLDKEMIIKKKRMAKEREALQKKIQESFRK
ncbi:MAG: hypothetical protein KKG59_00265 [Nanoarchaeota archaeon]|nr:hypothetical protein [Nanoarchaeota archaeon]